MLFLDLKNAFDDIDWNKLFVIFKVQESNNNFQYICG